jgi:DNA-binding cell septation regulator SpoVG
MRSAAATVGVGQCKRVETHCANRLLHRYASRERKDGKYREVAYALDAKTRKMIEEAVIDEYEKVAGKQTR